MNIEIGSRIKALRLAASMTQEQLAQRLGLSAQAVSKWETGATMPDILLLPDLAVIFGVSIDELFAMTDESRMERIDNMLENLRFIPDADFENTERWLLERCKQPEAAPRATLLLARLYNKRADGYRELAGPLARQALLLNPEEKQAHNAVFDAESGPYQDWNFINHHGLIDFYRQFVELHPQDRRGYYWLLDLLIADGRTAEAREYAERMKSVARTYHYEMYMGHICRAECDLAGALDWWRRMTEFCPEHWVVWAERASCMAKLGRYDEAVEHYLHAMPLRPAPVFIDCEEAVAHICEIRGDIAGAIEWQQRALELLRRDWVMEGELVDSKLREIERLRALL